VTAIPVFGHPALVGLAAFAGVGVVALVGRQR
jgi:hypothetical protein